MPHRLRDNLDELDVYVTKIAAHTGIPAAHLEKDLWVTEVLRGATAASASTGCSVIFKGGTSLSKAHRLIQRFSEDVDLIVVLPDAGRMTKDKTLKEFVNAAADSTGLVPESDPNSTTRGVKRTSAFSYPANHASGAVKARVLMELGTRGGALPFRRLFVQPLVAEHAESAGLPVDFVEAEPVGLLVLEPVRTLVEKLVLLHAAASRGDERQRTITARHYYDVDQLLQNEAVIDQLAQDPIDIMAREVTQHSQAVGLSTSARPLGGFAASPAWDTGAASVAASAYRSVTQALIWPNAPVSTFEQCCQRIHSHASIL